MWTGCTALVKAHLAAKEHGIKLIIGTELMLTDGPPVIVYAMDAEGYANVCRLVSASRMSHPKGESGLPWRAVAERSEGLIALLPNPAPAGAGGAPGRGVPRALPRGAVPQPVRGGRGARGEGRRSGARRWECPCACTTTCTPTTGAASRCRTC